MNRNDSDQVTRLLTEAAEDISYGPEELATRLRALKTRPVPAEASAADGQVTADPPGTDSSQGPADAHRLGELAASALDSEAASSRDQATQTLERLYRDHAKGVQAAAMTATGGDASAAWDALQHAYLQAWRRLTDPGAAPVDHWAAWLTRVAIQHVARSLREQRRSDQVGKLDRARADSYPDLQTAIVEHDLEKVLKQIAALPLHERRALALHLIAGYTQAETAEIMEMPRSRVRALLAQARDALRESVAERDF